LIGSIHPVPVVLPNIAEVETVALDDAVAGIDAEAPNAGHAAILAAVVALIRQGGDLRL